MRTVAKGTDEMGKDLDHFPGIPIMLPIFTALGNKQSIN